MIKRDSSAMIQKLVVLISFEMSCSLSMFHFTPFSPPLKLIKSHALSCLPTFSNPSSPMAPLNVQFQCSESPPYRTVSWSFSITKPNPPPSSTSLLDPSILWLAPHKGKPPDRYGFPLLSTILDSIPSYYSQVGKEPCWQNTMAEELQALKAKHTWDLVPWPDFLLLEASGSTPLKSSDGSLDQYKAHLVAQGFKQE